MVRIILTRHGETIENQEGIFQGHLPGILTVFGIEQAKKLAERLKDENFDHIFSSDLARASDTTKEIVKYHSNTPIKFTESLRERFLGELQGKRKEDLGLDKTKLVAGLIESRDGESQKEMFQRARDFIEFLIENFQEKNILIVGHNGINLALMANILNKTFEEYKEIQPQSNCAISIFNIQINEDPVIDLWNSVEHLK